MTTEDKQLVASLPPLLSQMETDTNVFQTNTNKVTTTRQSKEFSTDVILQCDGCYWKGCY